MTKFARILAAAALIAPLATEAAETIVYRYDARGRLVKVERSGTVNNGVQVNYTHDKAHNRKTKVVTN